MSKHSPGPWVSTRPGAFGAPDKPGPSSYVHDANGDTIAYDVADEADARLIAAAPELLAALRTLWPWAIQMRTLLTVAHDTGERCPSAPPMPPGVDLIMPLLARIEGPEVPAEDQGIDRE